MIEDITRRKEANDRLRSITDAAHDAILMMDPRGAISYWNPAAERILGYAADEAIGKNLHDLLAPERYRAAHRRAFPEFARSGRGKAVGKTLELFAQRRDGSEISVSLSMSSVFLSGEWHAVGILTDITERKLAEERLHDALQRLQLATAAGSIGTWSWTFENDRLEWDDRLCDWYGVPNGDRRAGLYYEFWRTRVHPDDRDRAEEVLEQSRRDGVASEDIFRIILPDGRLRFIYSAWTFERDAAGNLVRTIGVNRDITQQHELEEELRAAKQLADAANAAKSEFLANMSHEIRTPMNGVIGMTGLLMDTELNSQQRRYAETIRSSGESLLTLINDILDFSKIEAGKLELEMLAFDLHSVLDEFASPLALRAQGKGIELICAVAPDVPSWLIGDSVRLRQILTNLVGNAVKFTEQGEISARAGLVAETESDVVIRFVIRDTGIGLTPEQQQHLFQKFSQADSSTSRRFGGTGLGLTIARQLVQLMGGEIGLTSKQGVGSEFWFTARLVKATQRPNPALPPAEIRGTRVLVVDDSAINREILLAQLAAWGIRAETASDGPAALRLLAQACEEQQPFRAALIDMRMPGMDGIALARAIRAESGFAATRLVLLTSLGRQSNAAELAQQGFAACLTKPIRQADLLDCLSRVLAGRFSTQRVVIRPDRESVPTLRRTRARILVAEDNVVNQDVALALLRKFELQASAVENGAQAIEALQNEHYDLVLMDVEMPEIDGLEATRMIRSPQSAVRNRQIPIVAMTAAAMQGDRERCLQAGMNAYISKPVLPQALLEALNAWLPPETA
jgi:PAS domain S-box-containing protein